MCVQKHRCTKIAHDHPGDHIISHQRNLRQVRHPSDNLYHHHILCLCFMFEHHPIPISLRIHSQYRDRPHAQATNESLWLSRHHHLVSLPPTPYLCSQVLCHLVLHAADITLPPSPLLIYHGQMHVRQASKIDLHASPLPQDSRSRGLKTQSG